MSTPLTPIDGERTEDTTDDLVTDLSADLSADGPELETDEDGDADKDLIEVGADATGAADEAASTDAEKVEPKASKSGRSMLALVLGVLLLVSVAVNLKQSRDIANLDARSQEYQQALGAAVERIDSESARAEGAEAALDRVDSAVDVVNERVLGLQEALDQLREATVR